MRIQRPAVIGPLGPPPTGMGASSAHRDDLQRTLGLQRAAALRTVPPAEHVIVVFGSPAGPDGRPAPPLAARLARALEAWRADPSALLVVSGGAVKGARESGVMRRALEAAGVPAHRVVEEGAARFTLENAELSAPLVARSGARKVSVVTERFHMGRAAALMRGALAGQGSKAQVVTAPAPDAARRPRGEGDKLARDLVSQRHLHALAQGSRPRVREWVA